MSFEIMINWSQEWKASASWDAAKMNIVYTTNNENKSCIIIILSRARTEQNEFHFVKDVPFESYIVQLIHIRIILLQFLNVNVLTVYYTIIICIFDFYTRVA